jgi:signal transduction histidine kinase/CheY-like chemotaxis protein
MEKKINIGRVIRRNYRDFIFVFAAFALMALASYFFIGRIIFNRLLAGAGDLLHSAEANIQTGLLEAETTLLNSYYVVQDMVERGASRQEILDYLTNTTAIIRRQDQRSLKHYGIYGFINGAFYDSIGLNPSADFIPQRRPWYQTAVRSGLTVAYTAPYEDLVTGDTIISAVRNIDVKGGGIVGILSVDINISWLMEYATALKLSPDGYGMLLNHGMTLIAHPNSAMTGRQLQDLGENYVGIAHTLRSGEDMFTRRIVDPDGSSVIVFFKQIFNGWYVGIVTPYSQFYQDLYTSAQVLAALGILLSFLLCLILMRLSSARMRAEEASKSKGDFLAKMSHEIRTPMNAIIGMAELALREERPEAAHDHIITIKQAGANLLSIINDILDFSKIESGKLEIVPVTYMLSSLINDTVNIIRPRLMEKPLRFFTNIDGTIPNSLIGDESRLRQILLNLLSNAVKYSEKGYIGLTIAVDKRDDKQVRLKIAVSDNGKGIKPEDQAKLFGEFVQVDMKKNQAIEGAGLGLAITKRLCVAMGGDISVESEYGKGSVFTAVISQGIESETPFAAVEESVKKKVLIYEGRTVYAKSICWTLENMSVPYIVVSDQGEFEAALYREPWFYVFSGYGLYEKIKPLMEKPEAAFSGGKKPPLALMVEWGTEAYVSGARFVSIPVQSLSIANVLNGKTDNKGYIKSSGTLRFTCPRARILVVDDIATNLQVAAGLLAPYQAKVDTCLNGLQSIEMVKCAAGENRDYDIIFMDHMMPEMDGIETAAEIRKWEKMSKEAGKGKKPIPIIALTANAIVGMKEMFLENGFNDFLAKPIDVSKLDLIVDKWIGKDKRERRRAERGDDQKSAFAQTAGRSDSNTAGAGDFPTIPGVDVQKGISMTGGTVAAYTKVLSLFCKDIEERIPLLQKALEEDTLPLFITQVHALKSASGSIGAQELSSIAAGLEDVGKNGDVGFIRENLSDFVQRLAELAKNISAVLKKDNAPRDNGKSMQISAHIPALRELSDALQSEKITDIKRVLDTLSGQNQDLELKEILEQISDQVLIAEFDSAAKIVDELIATEK